MKKIIFFFLSIIAICEVALFLFFGGHRDMSINMVEVNDVAENLKENWGALREDALPGKQYQFDYVVLDADDQVIASTKA